MSRGPAYLAVAVARPARKETKRTRCGRPIADVMLRLPLVQESVLPRIVSECSALSIPPIVLVSFQSEHRPVAAQPGRLTVTARQHRFATTKWSLVRAAADQGDPQSRDALESLCQLYWYPVFCFIRSRGHQEEQALDLTQGFFTHLIEKRAVDAARPDRGRFRSFLLASAKNFVANEWDKSMALKRGGGTVIVPLDASEEGREFHIEPIESETPEDAFARSWALAVLEKVLGRLSAEMETAGRSVRFQGLRQFLTAPATRSYAQVAGELGMTESAVKVAVHRLRRRYGVLLREEVSHTVQTPQEVEDEIRYLMDALSGAA